MKKRLIIMLVATLTTLGIAGCGNSIPEMTDEEMMQIEEYAAHLLLEYGTDYNSGILTQEEIDKKEEAMIKKAQHEAYLEQIRKEHAESVKEDDSKGSGGDGEAIVQPTLTDIDSFLDVRGIDIVYTSFEVCDSYPNNLEDNSFQGVTTATPGNKLVVFKFALKNETETDIDLDLNGKGIKASFKVNGGKTKSPLTTLLTNDFFAYKDTVAAGTTGEAIMIIQLSDSDAASITSVVMTLKYNGEKASKNLL